MSGLTIFPSAQYLGIILKMRTGSAAKFACLISQDGEDSGKHHSLACMLIANLDFHVQNNGLFQTKHSSSASERLFV